MARNRNNRGTRILVTDAPIYRYAIIKSLIRINNCADVQSVAFKKESGAFDRVPK